MTTINGIKAIANLLYISLFLIFLMKFIDINAPIKNNDGSEQRGKIANINDIKAVFLYESLIKSILEKQ